MDKTALKTLKIQLEILGEWGNYRCIGVKTAHSAMAGNSNKLVVMNGTYLMKSRCKIPALVK